MAWPYTPDDQDPYAVPGVSQYINPIQIPPPTGLLSGPTAAPYRGLLGSAPNQDVALALASLGAGIAGGQGRTRGEAWGSGLQQGMTGLLGTAALSGRQKAIEQEIALREQDRQMRAQQISAATAEQQRRLAAMEKLKEQYPQMASLIDAGLAGEVFKPQKVGPGDVVGIPGIGGQPLIQGGPKTPEASPVSRLIQERDALPPNSPLRSTYDQAIQKAVTVTPPATVNVGFQSPLAIDTPQGPRFVMPPNKPGGVPQILDIPGVGPALPPAPKAQKPTDVELTASGFHDRMAAAEGIISKIGSTGIPTYSTTAASSVGGLVGQAAEGKIMTPEQQMYKQAQDDWVSAKLRKESGAVLNKDEIAAEVKRYFPQPYDKPETIAQKARARQVAMEAMRKSAGPATQTPGQRTVLRFDANGNPVP